MWQVEEDSQMKMEVKYWKEFKEIPDGIRSSSKNPCGKLILVCESGTEKTGKIRKYYEIDSKKHVKELTAKETLTLLRSDDDSIYSTPPNYDELVAVGWKKFIDDIEQKLARDLVGPRISFAQQYIIKRLMDIARKREFQNKNQEIDALLQAFRLPLLRSLIKELSKLKKIDQAEPDDSSFFEILSQIYNNYELYSAVKKAENEIGTPKILYSRFLGKSDD